MTNTATQAQFAAAAAQVRHPVVRFVLQGNLWKMRTWGDYAQWKRHGRWCLSRGANWGR